METKKICKYCKTEIDKSAKICPNCRKKQGPKIFRWVVLALILLVVVACAMGSNEGTTSTDDKGNKKTEFSIGETATVNNTKIKINSVKKVDKECLWEYENSCQSYNEPENDFFIVVDLTIENKGSEELSISSILSFNLKDSSGEKGKYALLTESINSQLDNSIMPGDLLKGQIAYDVKDSEKYYFYYSDSLLDNQIKFIINKNDIK